MIMDTSVRQILRNEYRPWITLTLRNEPTINAYTLTAAHDDPLGPTLTS